MTASVALLQTCLEEETRLMSEFIGVLRDEAQVLEDGATESALASTTARKNEIADALAQLANQRNSLLSELGCGTDGAGLKAAAEQHPALADIRERLLNFTEQAQALNEANGRIIEVFLDHNQRTLDTLRRLVGVGDIYDSSGRKRSGNKGSGRNIKA